MRKITRATAMPDGPLAEQHSLTYERAECDKEQNRR